MELPFFLLIIVLFIIFSKRKWFYIGAKTTHVRTYQILVLKFENRQVRFTNMIISSNQIYLFAIPTGNAQHIFYWILKSQINDFSKILTDQISVYFKEATGKVCVPPPKLTFVPLGT